MDQSMGTLNYVMDYIPNGDLQTLLKHLNSSIEPSLVRHILFQLLEVIKFMQSKMLIHRDLKPENILFTRNMHIRLCDFGTAIDSSKEEAKTFLGSAYYVSPEVMKSKKATLETDIWSLGVILYEMVIGQKMFQGRSEYFVMQKIEKLDFPKIPASAQYKSTVEKLVVIDAEARRQPFQTLCEEFKDYELSKDIKIKPFCPLGKFKRKVDEEFTYGSFIEIENLDQIENDETDEVNCYHYKLYEDNCERSGKNLCEPPMEAVYYGDKIDPFFNGIKNLARARDILRKQQEWQRNLKKLNY